MKSISKLATAALVIFLTAIPAWSSWVITGIVSYNNPEALCNRSQGDICTTAVDSEFGDGWAADDGSVRNIIANNSTHNWALMQVVYSDYQPLVGNQFIDLLPDFPFDAKMTSMTPATRNNLDVILTKWGIPTTCSSNADGYRDFIRCVGSQIRPTWDERSWGN